MKGHLDLTGYLIERGMVLIDDLQEDSERCMLWFDLLILTQRDDTPLRALAGEIIDSIMGSLLPEVVAALFPEWHLKRWDLDIRERILCLIHFLGGLVVNLGIRLKLEEAKLYWEIVTRMFFEEECSHEAP